MTIVQTAIILVPGLFDYKGESKGNRMMDLNELFWNCTLEELKRGYVYLDKEETYICLICGHNYDAGEIYLQDDKYYDAKKMMTYHIQNIHDGMFNYLINMNKKYTELSENQEAVLKCIKEGMNDSEISFQLKLSKSTIRNYRFKFREREKQAKVFMAIMELINSRNKVEYHSIEPHKTATMIDDRYDITEQEAKKILGRYFDGAGKLIDFPSKEKRKIMILSKISQNFKEGVEYTEKEVNRILERIYHDYVLIRRYLIEYGYMDRNTDGSKYWMK